MLSSIIHFLSIIRVWYFSSLYTVFPVFLNIICQTSNPADIKQNMAYKTRGCLNIHFLTYIFIEKAIHVVLCVPETPLIPSLQAVIPFSVVLIHPHNLPLVWDVLYEMQLEISHILPKQLNRVNFSALCDIIDVLHLSSFSYKLQL